MKTKITVGEVEISVDGLELSKRDIWRLLRLCGSISVALGEDADEPEKEPKTMMGFAAQMELDPERNLEPDLSEWFEESP